jgi:hypothetical protein
MEKISGTNLIDISSLSDGIYLLKLTGKGWESHYILSKD